MLKNAVRQIPVDSDSEAAFGYVLGGCLALVVWVARKVRVVGSDICGDAACAT